MCFFLFYQFNSLILCLLGFKVNKYISIFFMWLLLYYKIILLLSLR